MVTQSLERRRSRASFTKTLERICARLDESPVAQGKWPDRLLGRDDVTTIEAISLWVAGSYARGATECGDLDLILEYKVIQGHAPGGRRAGQTLFGSPPDVRVYGGSPQKNESGVAFEEGVLVWQGRDFDWKNAIASIQANPEAERFSRPTDPIPFRTEQLAADVEHLEEIANMEANGLLQWTFTPMAEIEPASPLGDEELNLERLLKIRSGQKTLKLLPYLLGYFRKFGGWPKPRLRSGFDKLEFGIGGAKVLLGRPYPAAHVLDEVTVADLIVVPHITARGPNGFWAIQRGPNHPLEKAASALSAFHLVDENGEPPIFNLLSPRDWPGASTHSFAKGLDFFTTKRKATSWAKMLLKDGEGDFQVVLAKGTTLLRMLAHLDVVFWGEREIALTHTGCHAMEIDTPTSTPEIIELLSSP